MLQVITHALISFWYLGLGVAVPAQVVGKDVAAAHAGLFRN
jgi:hypothetical protein